MAKPSYYELLQSPQWQKKRLELLSSANFTCSRCGSTDRQLHVHHGYYEKGKKPWEYDDYTYHVVCDKCHEDFELAKSYLYWIAGQLPCDSLEEVAGYATAIAAVQGNFTSVAIPPEKGFVAGVAKYFGKSSEWINERVKDGKFSMRDLENA